jgi:hypothetical protein
VEVSCGVLREKDFSGGKLEMIDKLCNPIEASVTQRSHARIKVKTDMVNLTDL